MCHSFRANVTSGSIFKKELLHNKNREKKILLNRAGASERTAIQKKWDPRGGLTHSLKGIKGGSSLFFFTLVCANLFRYHTDVIFSYLKASYQSFLLNGNL